MDDAAWKAGLNSIVKMEAEIDQLKIALTDAINVLRMVDDNHRVDAGEKRKAWDGKFVIAEVRRVLG